MSVRSEASEGGGDSMVLKLEKIPERPSVIVASLEGAATVPMKDYRIYCIEAITGTYTGR